MSTRPTWKGEDIGEMAVSHLVKILATIQTQQEADAMLEQLMGIKPLPLQQVKDNIGYLTGYMSDEEAKRTMQLFNAPHPLLGFRRDHSALDMIAIGAALYKQRHPSQS